MTVERKVVEHVARLARLQLGEEELERHRKQLGAVLDYVAQLEKVDVRGLEPLAHPAEAADVFREDVPRSGLSADAALANAPERSDGFFVVPKVVE
jgi:aspartyl-tRNA(Asn)/glutamyl-tRNA(Gln) amidotransferase subunit C